MLSGPENILTSPNDAVYYLELWFVIGSETSLYTQPSITLLALWIRHLFFVQPWHTTQSLPISVVVRQCWRLLSSRQLILVAKAEGLPTICIVQGCGPASTIIFLIILKPLCESLEHCDFRRIWLFRIVRSRRWRISCLINFQVLWLKEHRDLLNSLYKLWPCTCPFTFLATCFTAAWVAVMSVVAHFLSFPKYNSISCV
jgi:hypothetical protein